MTAPARKTFASARPLAELVDSCLGPALAKQGFAGADILVNWPEIAGEALAKRSRPIRLAWPRRPAGGRGAPPPEPATLHVRVESAFALDLQHLAPVIVERINAYFGWACVGRLRLEQGPVGRGSPAKEPAPQPSASAVAAAEKAASSVADEGLRASLTRLGAAVIDRERSARGAKS